MRALVVLAACVLAALPGPVAGQSGAELSGGTLVSPVLVIRQEDLFDASAFGKASNARREEASRALIAENRQIEAALEAEERDLTERRPALPAAEFRVLAEAFNDKVEGIRQAQDAKARAIGRAREEDRARFLQALVPVLAEIMAERGAVVILDQASVVLSFDRVDITDEAVARIDARIGNGESPDPAPVAAPEAAPDPAPEAAADPGAAPAPSPPPQPVPGAAPP